MHLTQKTKSKIKLFSGLLIILSAGLFISACSSGSGSSGGTTSGTGSSSVEGNVVSVDMAMLQPANTEEYFFSDFLKTLISPNPVYAATTVGGIQVEIAGIQTTTNSGGYFKINGVPPGTHEVRFSGNGYSSSMQVDVGENDMVTIQDVSMNGQDARARSVSHRTIDNSRDRVRDDDRNDVRNDDRNDDRDMDRNDDRNDDRDMDRNDDRNDDRDMDRNDDRNDDRDMDRDDDRNDDRDMGRDDDRNDDRDMGRDDDRNDDRNMDRNDRH